MKKKKIPSLESVSQFLDYLGWSTSYDDKDEIIFVSDDGEKDLKIYKAKDKYFVPTKLWNIASTNLFSYGDTTSLGEDLENHFGKYFFAYYSKIE